jgi:hypothetical protein
LAEGISGYQFAGFGRFESYDEKAVIGSGEARRFPERVRRNAPQNKCGITFREVPDSINMSYRHAKGERTPLPPPLELLSTSTMVDNTQILVSVVLLGTFALVYGSVPRSVSSTFSDSEIWGFARPAYVINPSCFQGVTVIATQHIIPQNVDKPLGHTYIHINCPNMDK